MESPMKEEEEPDDELNHDTSVAKLAEVDNYKGTVTSAVTELVTSGMTDRNTAAMLQDVYLRGSTSKVVQATIATPVLVLSNNHSKGTMEANVMLDHTMSPTFLQVAGQFHNLHAMAQASLIAETQDRIAKQLEEVTDDSQKLKSDTATTTGDQVYQFDIEGCGKVYQCDTEGCGKTFTSSGYKKTHEASHSGAKSLECSFEGCGRKFAWPAHLKYHQLTHTGKRQYCCELEGCGKKFFTAQRLIVHMRTHTGEKPFVCQEAGCNKSFTTAGNLKNHQRIHSGERPYACDHEGCGRKFTEYSSLRKHKLVHTGEKPFTCEICGRTFTQSGSRMVHMKKHEMSKSSGGKCGDRDGSDMVIEVGNQDILVLQPGEEDISQYQDLHGSESVVFSQGLTDHVVTVTTQPADGDSDHIELGQDILGAEEVLGADPIHTEEMRLHSKGVNVVVLSQPQEIVTLTSAYHQSHGAGREEIVYENELLHSDLDHEEIAHSEFSLQSLTHTSQGTSVNDSILATQSVLNSQQSLSEHGDISSSSQAGKEMALDPMMESDEESDIATLASSKTTKG